MRKKYTLTAFSILLAFVILSGGCKKAVDPPVTEAEEPKPQVTFTIGAATQKDPFTYSFKGVVKNYKEVIWSFGDGTSAYDTEVTHTYLIPGTYKVILKALNSLGYWAQQEAQVIIRAQDIVNFTAEPQVDGSLKLQPKMSAEIQDFSWYIGTAATGVPIATTQTAIIPKLTTPDFTYITLKVKTAKGAEAYYSKIITNFGDLKDITGNGVDLSVSLEHSAGSTSAEGSLKLIDGSNTTKYLISGYTNTFWMQQKVKSPAVVNAYVFVSGNDVVNRDPMTWDFVGSQDGITWVTLDSRRDIKSDVRFETRAYAFNNTTAYNYYRVNVKAVRSGTSIQLSEWRLMSTY
ncbi:PKD domain-containing protein [Pedobacter nyackensis]|uniref:PKD repeat-containing protein n=1 Tax=Pedobacter nyackensis TaxID=475255 RepID=A0A1W2CQ00_9SPHI|nr:PKD domain-containing protein [Pedobacter nyackensis]SMC87289.1 PKD repeat-containing protein [Pedobacter nyackensis]